MKKFQGMLLACDMDGTLLDSNRQISANNKQALCHFTEEGGRFVLATGRAFPAVRPYLTQLPCNAPYILLNGSLIMDEQHAVLHCAGMPEETIALIDTILSEFSQLGCEIFLHDHILVRQMNEVTAHHMEVLNLSYSMVTQEELNGTADWCQINFTGEPAAMEGVRMFLKPYPQFFTASSLPTFCEVTRLHVHKGSALQQIAADCGIEKEHIFAVGDSYNDEMMLRAAQIGFAPSNAEDGILKAADVIVSDNNQDAIADVIDYLEAHLC